MDNSSSEPSDKPDSKITSINDFPSVLKEFFSNLSIDVEKNKWTARCGFCSSSITDSYKTTSNFQKHLKNRHQGQFNEWKNNSKQSANDTNQGVGTRTRKSRYSPTSARKSPVTPQDEYSSQPTLDSCKTRYFHDFIKKCFF